MKLITLPFLVLMIISGCTFCAVKEKGLKKQVNVKEFLSTLSSEERFFLEHFFRCLIQEDAIGYVLLGGKPMSFYSYEQPKTIAPSTSEPVEQLDRFFEGLDERNALFHKGWKIWNKYKDLFCGENIFFDVFEQDKELKFIRVIVINKSLVLPLWDQHLHKFIPLKNKENFFEALLHDQKFKEKFYSRHDLMGICLGYGEKNAVLYQKMLNLFTSMGLLDFTLQMPSADRLKCLEEEWSDLKKFFKVGIKDHSSQTCLFHYGVGFRADFSDVETTALQRKYTKYHKKITAAYDNANFLEKTFELILSANRLQ